MTAPCLNLDVSQLKINDEAVALIINSLALECHDFALASGIPSGSVELQLPGVLDVFSDLSHHLIDCRAVVTGITPCIANITVGMSAEVYRLIALAAKDRVAHVANGDANV